MGGLVNWGDGDQGFKHRAWVRGQECGLDPGTTLVARENTHLEVLDALCGEALEKRNAEDAARFAEECASYETSE